MDNPQASWDLSHVGVVPTTPVPEKRYSLRLLGYWFIQHLLAAEQSRNNRPLTVCEIEPDLGQLLTFIRRSRNDSPRYATWDAICAAPWRRILRHAGYGRVHEGCLAGFSRSSANSFSHSGANNSANNSGAYCYDVIILLNILEHTDDPARLLANLMPDLRNEGIFVGGLKRRNGRLSARGLKDVAWRLGLTIDFLGGTFFLPARGRVRESRAWWIRINLFLGAVFPALSSDLYWVLRKNQ